MAFTAFRGMKPFPQLMFSVFVIIVSFLAFMVLSLIIAIPLFGLEPVMNLSLLNDFNDAETIFVLKYFQVVQSIGLFIVPPLILGWLFYGQFTEYLYLNKQFAVSSLLLVFVIAFFAAPFINFIGEINAKMQFPGWLSGIESWMKNAEEKAAVITEAFLKVDSVGALLFNIFMIAFLPAIGEELLFRGVIQRIFTNMTKNHHRGIWISAILFSALHLQFYGFVPRMFLGVLFGYMLVWGGSMWLPIIAHFLNNALAVIAMFMIDKNMLNPEVEEIGSSNGSYYLAAISLLLVVIFMWMIKRQNVNENMTVEQTS
ncbi:MAG: CPBP family intramembrane metalloprotease [Prolixibacteraceae bacterium]|nr:CPBP family intramembrane metalloprotease [Prolixibacteraceae bacterium]MBT6764077.1 CPBP family intramembrane metalloprotease [Prolixibacteraceae bacterium]MBT6999331.1 CPBP family intramembrane metalloprotease [Prolixibacteraceae bacterium]MBT7395446.1 CPBP family intramembrane metalloprotease [Prolixibacteraceae bacterium]